MPAPGYNIQSLFRILPQHTVARICAKLLELPQTGFLRGNQLWAEGSLDLSKLIGWFQNLREQIADDEDICLRLAALPIYPSARRLYPLTNLVLPGGFEDPLGLTSLVDVGALGGRREFLISLGADELEFRAYVLNHLSKALEEDELDRTVRQEAVTLLADRLGELIDDDEVRQRLSLLSLVPCADEEYRRADMCYFPDTIVQEMLGDNANIAVLPEEREAAVRSFLAWLGVASEPRSRDIVRTVQRTANGPRSTTAVDRTQKIVAHLGRRFGDLKKRLDLQPLQSIEWLPARRDTTQWHRPSSLYAPYQSYLFESQARILDIPTPDRDLLEFLGVHINPAPDLVVRHLLHCAERDELVNREVYRFLNDEADDPAIDQLSSTKCLWLGHSYQSPRHVFWGDHRFGQYRWRLADDLRGYGTLLDKIGVADAPSYRDSMHVLVEISAKFGETNRPLDDETYAVLVNCWQMLEEALDDGTVSEDWFGGLRARKSIPNPAKTLDFPTRLFFENRAGLADKFEGFLTNNVIQRQLGTERAFLAAGVQQLGSAVQQELLRNDNAENDPDMIEWIHQRQEEFARVLHPQMASHDVTEALSRLRRLDCKSATSLVLRYRLDAFDRVLRSQPETVAALYQPDSHCLWTTNSIDQLQWAPLARELAVALCPEEDPGLFAAGLKEVLAADTASEAAVALDELGFSRLDTTVIEAPTQEAAHTLGTDNPIDTVEDEIQTDATPGDKEARTPAEPKSSSSGDAATVRRWEFVSYVAVSPEDEETPEQDGTTHRERMTLEDKAIQLILTQEPQLTRMSTNNPGFDLTEKGPDGQPVKWVEVKAMSGTLRNNYPVGISKTQFELAQERRGAYWLYVVESAGDPNQARIVRIQDPAGKARTFTFDHGWIAVAKDT